MFNWTGPLIVFSTLVCVSFPSQGRWPTNQGGQQVKESASQTASETAEAKSERRVRQAQRSGSQGEGTPTPQETESSQARVAPKTSAQAKRSKDLWAKGVNTVIRLKGDLGGDSSQCHTFNVKMTERLQYQIKCGEQEKAGTIHLSKKDNYTVTRHGKQLTITRFNYLIKKPQTSQFEQNTLKIPYVEQIIHVKKNDNGELAFYLESFKVDEFGRIVQDGFIQAHGLSGSGMKISSNR